MKLTDNAFELTDAANKRYVKLKDTFARFMQGAGYLTEPRSSVTGLEIKPNLDANQFDVLFAGMVISFRFSVLYGADDLLTGNVVIVRNSPTFCDKADIIGRFSFDRQGITDFENSNGSKLEIEYNPAEIVLHFLVQALRKALPNSQPANSTE